MAEQFAKAGEYESSQGEIIRLDLDQKVKENSTKGTENSFIMQKLFLRELSTWEKGFYYKNKNKLFLFAVPTQMTRLPLFVATIPHHIDLYNHSEKKQGLFVGF